MILHPSLTTVTPLSKTLAVILFVAFPFVGFYVGMQAARLEYQSDVKAVNSVIETENAEARAKARASSTNPVVPLQDKLAMCIDETKAAAAKVDYEKGTILVTFGADVTFKTMQSTLEDYNLTLANSIGAEEKFKTQKWVIVKVPKGEEFRWICIVKGDKAVKYTGLNQTFSLHE